jgi:hypothetical protein
MCCGAMITGYKTDYNVAGRCGTTLYLRRQGANMVAVRLATLLLMHLGVAD